MGRARQIAGRGNNDSLVLDSSAADTDVGELLLLDGTDASSSNDGFSILQEDATDNAFVGGPFVFSEAPMNVANPAFMVKLTADYTLSDATTTKIPFDFVEYDVGGYFDNHTLYKYTPLVAGYYLFTSTIQGLGSVDVEDQITYLYKNGEQSGGFGRIRLGGITNDDLFATSVTCTAVLHMDGVRDNVHIRANMNSEDGGSPIVNDSSYFHGVLLQRTS